MNQSGIYFLSILFLIGCTEERKENVSGGESETITEKKVKTETPVQTVIDEPVSYELLDSSIRSTIPKLDSIYGKTPYYIRLGEKILFYVAKGDWQGFRDGKFNPGVAMLGIADQDCKLILPLAYTKIYNPDATVQGYIEIEYKGKRGLFNYTNGKIIAPEYDVIFPSDTKDYLAIGKKGDLHCVLSPDAKEKQIENNPTYIALAQKWKFDISAKNIRQLYGSYYTHYANDPAEGNGVVFTPSYLFNLGYIPEVVQGIGQGKNLDFGLTASKGTIVESRSITDKVYAFISSYYEEGVDVRGWEINNHNLITVDSKNNVISNEYFLHKGYNGEYCGTGDFKFIKNNLLEVCEVKQTEKDYPAYDGMTLYSYYEIQNDGKIIPLESFRFFDCTKFILMNEEYLQGCFYKRRDIMEETEEVGNLWVSEHLTIEDLDLMRNEIYAEYGLKFKTEKWHQYFSKQGWYKGEYENVDRFLSETDKKNIQLILSVKEKMTGKENSITKKKLIMYAAPG